MEKKEGKITGFIQAISNIIFKGVLLLIGGLLTIILISGIDFQISYNTDKALKRLDAADRVLEVIRFAKNVGRAF